MRLVERLNLIPATLRASAGLPCGNVQEADIAAELEQHSETMRSLHEEAKKHWLSKAENFTNARHKFHLDEEMAHTGILTKPRGERQGPARGERRAFARAVHFGEMGRCRRRRSRRHAESFSDVCDPRRRCHRPLRHDVRDSSLRGGEVRANGHPK